MPSCTIYFILNVFFCPAAVFLSYHVVNKDYEWWQGCKVCICGISTICCIYLGNVTNEERSTKEPETISCRHVERINMPEFQVDV